MISKTYHFKLVCRILFLTAVSILIGWSVFQSKSLFFIVLFTLTLVIQVFELIYFVNKTNRKIAYFFDAIKNEDSTLFFPVDSKNRIIRDLYSHLNKFNSQLQQTKIENQQQEQYFRTLLEHSATGILTVNEKGFIMHANSAIKKIIGADVLTHVNQLERIDKKFCNLVKSIKPREEKVVPVSTVNGEIQISVKATTFKINEEVLKLLSVQDIKNELDKKELDSWLKLIRVLMHEIMNSITPVTSLSESLSSFFIVDKKPILPEKVDEKIIERTIKGLNVIKDQGRSLISFVDSYRKLARLPLPDKKVLSVLNLVEKIMILSAALPNADKTEINYKIIPPGLTINADENQITQVLINLVKNAFEANINNEHPKIKIIGSINSHSKPEIVIADNGPGIPEEVLSEIFVPFFTSKEKGSGIGLSISRQIMLAHNGTISVVTKPNEGCVFRLQF